MCFSESPNMQIMPLNNCLQARDKQNAISSVSLGV
uniref:Uncharacterized protein n=1 Tax=Arundo donax TaxID=35708 RepID=A0A0A8ZBS9_ARUDO